MNFAREREKEQLQRASIDLGPDIHDWQPAADLAEQICSHLTSPAVSVMTAAASEGRVAGYAVERRDVTDEDHEDFELHRSTKYLYRVVPEGAHRLPPKPTKVAADEPTKVDDEPTKVDDEPTKVDDEPTKPTAAETPESAVETSVGSGECLDGDVVAEANEETVEELEGTVEALTQQVADLEAQVSRGADSQAAADRYLASNQLLERDLAALRADLAEERELRIEAQKNSSAQLRELRGLRNRPQPPPAPTFAGPTKKLTDALWDVARDCSDMERRRIAIDALRDFFEAEPPALQVLVGSSYPELQGAE